MSVRFSPMLAIIDPHTATTSIHKKAIIHSIINHHTDRGRVSNPKKPEAHANSMDMVINPKARLFYTYASHKCPPQSTRPYWALSDDDEG